jgi:hypothetical protein
MDRRIDHYLRNQVDEDRFAFYEEVHRFGSEAAAPHLLKWNREHALLPDGVIREMGEMGLCGCAKATVTPDQFPHPHCRRRRHVA